jgi:hypothetical protein
MYWAAKMMEDLFIPPTGTQNQYSFFSKLSDTYITNPKDSITSFQTSMKSRLSATSEMFDSPFVIRGEYKLLIKKTEFINCHRRITNCEGYSRDPDDLEFGFKTAKENGFNFKVLLYFIDRFVDA